MEKKNLYVIDSCSMIDLNRNNPIDIFPSLWKKIEGMIKSKMMVSHVEVFKEISKQDDELTEWVNKHKPMFKDVSEKQIKVVKEILKKFPSFVKKEGKHDADP